jgi:hypothetical protein
LGIGEVADNGSPNKPFHLSLLIGRSLTGVQAGDVSRIVNFLKLRPYETAGVREFDK